MRSTKPGSGGADGAATPSVKTTAKLLKSIEKVEAAAGLACEATFLSLLDNHLHLLSHILPQLGRC